MPFSPPETVFLFRPARWRLASLVKIAAQEFCMVIGRLGIFFLADPPINQSHAELQWPVTTFCVPIFLLDWLPFRRKDSCHWRKRTRLKEPKTTNMQHHPWWTLSKGKAAVGVGRSKVVEGVADEEDEVVEEAPGDSGPRSIGVFKGLTARELNRGKFT